MIETVGFLAYATVLVLGVRWWDRRAAARARQHAHPVRTWRLPEVHVEREDLAIWTVTIALAVLVGTLVPLLLASRY